MASWISDSITSFVSNLDTFVMNDFFDKFSVETPVRKSEIIIFCNENDHSASAACWLAFRYISARNALEGVMVLGMCHIIMVCLRTASFKGTRLLDYREEGHEPGDCRWPSVSLLIVRLKSNIISGRPMFQDRA